MTIEKLRRFAAGVAIGVMTVVLVGCGGGAGAGGQGAGQLVAEGTGGPTPELPGDAGASTSTESSARLIQLVTRNSSTLPTDGRTPVELEAYVMDKNNVALPDQVVTFVAIDAISPAGVRLQMTDGGKTDATGRASATLLLSGNPTNRAVTVAAKVGELSSPLIAISVTGTSLTISGPSAITQGGRADYTISLRDSGGSPVASQTVAITSKSGNAISPATLTTSSSGQGTVQVSGAIAGPDTLTVSGAGASASLSLDVSDRSLAFAAGSAARLPIGPIGGSFVINYFELGGVPAGTWANLATTRGKIMPTDIDISSGSAAFSVSSQQAGLAKLTAVAGNVTTTWPVMFYATTPSLVDLQSSPQIIAANVGDSTDQRSALYVTVRDASGNPVPGRRIALTTAQDPSGGVIDPPVVVTDASGRAQSSFIAGSNVTAPNAVVVVARDMNASPLLESSPASLTVSGRELFVRVNTGNKVESEPADTPPVYRKRFAVIVTDSAGNGVSAVSIQAKLIFIAYSEGEWVWPQGGLQWEHTGRTVYPSEDGPGFDGVCTAGEDDNGDGYLTPGNVASVSGAAATGADGIAELVVTYPKGFATWVEVILEVTGRSAGTESQAAQRFWLPVAADDLRNAAVPPPGGGTSPFPYPRDSSFFYPGLPGGSCPGR